MLIFQCYPSASVCGAGGSGCIVFHIGLSATKRQAGSHPGRSPGPKNLGRRRFYPAVDFPGFSSSGFSRFLQQKCSKKFSKNEVDVQTLLNVNSAKLCEIHNLLKLFQIFLNLKFNFLRIREAIDFDTDFWITVGRCAAIESEAQSSAMELVFVQIAKCICSNYNMY